MKYFLKKSKETCCTIVKIYLSSCVADVDTVVSLVSSFFLFCTGYKCKTSRMLGI